MMLFALLISLLPSALAGAGPWVISSGDTSFYGGAEMQRFTKLALSSGSGADDVVDVDDGLETVGVKAVASYGLRDRFEIEAMVPWYRVDANTKGPVCAALSLGACRTTQGIGVVSARLKGLVLDELVGRPVSLAVGTEARFGQHTAPDRERITNLSEGTNDLGGFVSVGRSGGLAQGFWSAWAEAGGRYRFPNTELSVGAVPGAEVFGDVEVLAGAQRWWSLGPSATFLHRPTGYDVEDILGSAALATDIDRWGALSITSLRIGGKLIVRSSERIDLVAGVLTTAWAVNNPSDVTTVSLGVSIHPGPEAL
jgi:hypothetical protein